jgi:hypothetical protein
MPASAYTKAAPPPRLFLGDVQAKRFCAEVMINIGRTHVTQDTDVILLARL